MSFGPLQFVFRDLCLSPDSLVSGSLQLFRALFSLWIPEVALASCSNVFTVVPDPQGSAYKAVRNSERQNLILPIAASFEHT